MIMKQFDMTRFGRVVKLDFAEGRKALMWGALCMLLLYLFFFWFAHNIGMTESHFDYTQRMMNLNDAQLKEYRIKEICNAVAAFGVIAMFIYFLIAASTLYRGEQKKQQRIAWLMLPANNLEKFASRWVYLLAFSVVGGVLPFFVADGIHMVYLWMDSYPMMASTDDFFRVFPHVAEPYGPRLRDVVAMYLMLVAIHSFYLFGGVFFKKFHFIAASAVLAISFSVFVGLLNAIYSNDTSANSGESALWIMMIVSACCIALFTWLAYRLFCRWQVVTNKFANI